ncbi:MAG: hypothetical protein WBP45_15555 [Daejeonella sp.]
MTQDYETVITVGAVKYDFNLPEFISFYQRVNESLDIKPDEIEDQISLIEDFCLDGANENLKVSALKPLLKLLKEMKLLFDQVLREKTI